MKTLILAPALGLAALTLAACGPKTDAANNTAADTVTLNEEGDAGAGNSDAFEAAPAGNDVAPDNATSDNALPPAEGNAL